MVNETDASADETGDTQGETGSNKDDTRCQRLVQMFRTVRRASHRTHRNSHLSTHQVTGGHSRQQGYHIACFEGCLHILLSPRVRQLREKLLQEDSRDVCLGGWCGRVAQERQRATA